MKLWQFGCACQFAGRSEETTKAVEMCLRSGRWSSLLGMRYSWVCIGFLGDIP
jgi:hypothetical protein